MEPTWGLAWGLWWRWALLGLVVGIPLAALRIWLALKKQEKAKKGD